RTVGTEEPADRDPEPLCVKGVGARSRSELGETPQGDRLEDGPQRLAALSELEVPSGLSIACDDACLLEFSQPGGEHVGRDTWESRMQIGVPKRSEKQLADDEQRPAIAEHVQCLRDRAVLPVLPGAD